MKQIIFGLILVLMVMACRKSATDTPPPLSGATTHDSTVSGIKVDTQKTVAPYPQAPVNGCLYAPVYGDTIIYPQPATSQDYIVSPVNSPGTGKYLSWPVGMVIDSTTGAIDITQTEGGMRYVIGFVKNGTKDTCISSLIIGGASYMDSVYVVDNGGIRAVPYFDANPYLPSVCNGNSNGGGNGNKCSFDVTGTAAFMRVSLNKGSGEINLQKTLNGTNIFGGVFGLLPVNGQAVTVPIYYKIKDASNDALQQIDVQFVYYDKRSSIASGLLNGVSSKLTNILSGNLITTTSNPRPPLVIIVRRP